MSNLAEKKREIAKNHELEIHKNIPYLVHITPNVILTDNGDYLQTIRISGASFESADDEQINNWHDRINKLLRSISSENISIWQHLVRREENTYPAGDFPEGFAKNLNHKYAARITGHLMMVNELYLTIVYRPQVSRIGKAIWGFLSSRNKKASQDEREESLGIIDKVAKEIESTLMRYDSETLGIYTHNGILFSEPVEFFAFLINGEWNRIALSQAPLNFIIASTRPFFGMETVELRQPDNTIYGAMLGINAYPPESHAVFLNNLLSSSFSFVLTQSFSFLHQETAKRKMKLSRNRMINANDDSVSQIEEINDALDDIVAKRWVMGDHHFSLFVKGNSIRALTDNIAKARTSLSEAGITVAREDLALVSAFWAQLPANFKHRPRISAINSLNFSGFAPMHNFPMGRKENNHWGAALTMYITSAKTPYYFSFHASDPTDTDGGTKKDVGHTLVLGPTGSGKTAWIAFNLCMLQKFNTTSILFTEDRDTEILIRALGGKFYPIVPGQNTGWNPFWLDPNDPKTIPYLNRLVCLLISRTKKGSDGKDSQAHRLTITEEKDIADAISEVMKRDLPHRRLGRVLDYLPKNRGGIYERLSQWCYAREAGMKDGNHAWVFDNPTDNLIENLGSSKTTGFDLTLFLDDPELRTPINMHLFHLVNKLVDGRRLALFISEFWKALDDEQFASFAKDQLKTIRKNNGFVVLDSQSPSDALSHAISRTLIEQTPTKILFPNPDANYEEYVNGLNLSDREYDMIKTDIAEGSRMFLIKQGHHSVVAQLDLKGFDFELSILSSRKSNIAIIEQLLSQHGEDPEQWIPYFKEARKIA